jgi:hypothetical protein
MESVSLCVGCYDAVVEILNLLLGYFVCAFLKGFFHHQLVHWIFFMVGHLGGVCCVSGFCFLLWVKKSHTRLQVVWVLCLYALKLTVSSTRIAVIIDCPWTCGYAVYLYMGKFYSGIET